MQQRYLIGTLFEEEQQNKKTNLSNMKAKDPFGNSRWKGAFTGGFEAGYKNTCGSRDGWEPASFVSSVLNRADRKQQHIFDYMDKEDLGKESIGENISLNDNFSKGGEPLKFQLENSIGQKILSKMRKQEAFLNTPENPKDLEKLLRKYEVDDKIQNKNYSLITVKNFQSVGSGMEDYPEDDFLIAYHDLFRKVIRGTNKQQTEEQRGKRREENKIYFDFTKPLEEEPDYLRQIQEIQETSKPKKRKKNILNEQKLKDVFQLSKPLYLLFNSKKSTYPQIAENYDPYHRIQNIKSESKSLIISSQQQKKQKVYSLNQRSDILGEAKLANKFKSSSIGSNKFVRASQQQKNYEKIFEDEKKNGRYWDFVMEIEGKKISAQLQTVSYEEAQKQKEEFEAIYKLRKDKKMPQKVQEALLKQNKKEVRVVRKTGEWKPDKILCKRLSILRSYTHE